MALTYELGKSVFASPMPFLPLSPKDRLWGSFSWQPGEVLRAELFVSALYILLKCFYWFA